MNLSLFEELKPTLKDKWLNYYEANRLWLKELPNYYNAPEKGSRPTSELILGVITTLEPRLKELLFNFLLVSKDINKIVDVLGLNFDPEKELEKRRKQNCNNQPKEIVTTPQQE